MARIELRRVAKRWGPVTAVEPTDLAIADGEFVAILGPSGCGKSTTLFMLAGIYEPSEGDILFDGARVNEVEARDRNVGIVFQSYALYPHMTARDNILFPLRFKRMPRAEAVRRAEETARLVQIEELLGRRPAEMSGGQQQRGGGGAVASSSGGAGPGSREGAAAPPPRRAALQPRRQPAAHHAQRDKAAAALAAA